ncbi:PIN domain-containing protein [Sphingopyxis sp.]|uniref:PIN domain-containing protein n=1 Tax=Sphingopyxis sp. TaxID=1908224 RepID=UPI002B48B2EA|nr:PIN domain-containing protein [Sphingopyxis sp.]HJS10187.1 PIN domain-containing protein [Sphingopyxis sp.]
MAYDAFTIDTNIADEASLNLTGGLLGQLTQFKDGQIEVVLSEIVVREMLKHLVDQVKKTHDTLVSAASRAENVRLVEGAAADGLNAIIEGLGEPKKIASKRLSDYFEAVGAELIPSALASVEDLVRGYFGASAPFEAAGAKKNEFPDAIALLSIEAWAKAAGKKVLAVSKDKGWIAFAEKSEWIDVERDFGKALAIVQGHVAEADERVAAFLAALEAGGLPDLAEETERRLSDAVSDWNFMAEGSSAYSFEADIAELQFGEYALKNIDGEYDFAIVRLGSNQVAVRIAASISATALADFSLSIYDSIDKDYVGMGGMSAEREIEFDGAFLLTLTGDLAGPADELGVEGVELVDAVRQVDFGDISPDYTDVDERDYEEWLADEQDADVKADVEHHAAGLIGAAEF